MANFVFTNKFVEELGQKLYDMDTDTFKVSMTKSTGSYSKDAVNPTHSDNTAHEVAAGGAYTTGGFTLTSVAWTRTTNVTEFKADKIVLAQNASNPTDIRYLEVYHVASGRVVGYSDLGGDINASVANTSFFWNGVDGIGTIGTLTNN